MSRIARTPRAASAASAHCSERRADALALAERADRQRLADASRPRPRPARGANTPGRDAGVHRDERVAVEDAHEMRVPPHADALAEQRERHRIEGARDFDVAVGVHGALAGW